MRDDEMRDYVAKSRAAQGLPPTVEDAAVLRRVAALIRSEPERSQRSTNE